MLMKGVGIYDSYVHFVWKYKDGKDLQCSQTSKCMTVNDWLLDTSRFGHKCLGMDLCICCLCTPGSRDSQNSKHTQACSLHRDFHSILQDTNKLQHHFVLDKRHSIHKGLVNMVYWFRLDNLDGLQNNNQMDHRCILTNNNTLVYGSKLCNQHFDRKRLDMDPCISDLYMPDDLNIQSYWCTQACNMEDFQSFQVNTNKMLDLQWRGKARLVHTEKVDKDPLEFVEWLGIDIWQKDHQFGLEDSCILDCGLWLDIWR